MKRWVRENGSQTNREARRAKEKSINPFKELLKITKHFLPHLISLLHEVKDVRHQNYLYYEASLLLLVRILGAVMGINSMRNITEKFNRQECIDNIKKILKDFQIKELPHYDTINDFLEKLKPEELEKVCHKLNKSESFYCTKMG